MSPNRRSQSKKKSATSQASRLLLLLIPVVVLTLYGSFIQSPFAYDDHSHILENQLVTSFRSEFRIPAIYALFNTPSGFAGRPLLFLTYGLNYAASGADPSGFRWVNLILHSINSVLVFLIVFELGNLLPLERVRRFYLGLLASLIFAAHPLTTESVTYIAGRSSSMCATFYFAGLYSALRLGRAESRWRCILALLVAACTAVGWLVKQDAITLPAASMALIWLAWPTSVRSRLRWTATAFFLLTLVLLLAAQRESVGKVSSITLQNEILVAAGFEPTLRFVPYVLTSIKEYSSYYLWRLLVPAELSVDPDAVSIDGPISIGFLVSLSLLAGLTTAAVCGQRRLLAVGIALILVSPLSAYCLFPLADVVAEHRAYITLLGAAIVIADLLFASSRALAFSLVVLSTYGWMTIARNGVWTDEVLLWQDASAKAPNKIRPHLNLGALYQVRGELDKASHEFQFVLGRNPDHPSALANLASIYLARNDFANAEQLLIPAITRRATFPPIYITLGVVRLRQGRYEEARSLLWRAKALNPKQLTIHQNLGDIAFNEGQPGNAITEYLRELDLNPDSLITHLHLAKAYEVAGIQDKAIEEYRTVARLDPANSEAHAALQMKQ